MRQVPHYLLIGNGKLAFHLAHYWQQLGLSYDRWSRKRDPTEKSLSFLIKKADRILLLISDDAIEHFINTHSDLQQKQLIHCSGSLITPLALSAHPLMTFSTSTMLYSPEKYQQIAFILEKNTKNFHDLLPGLPNPHFYIPKESKPFYHALCVMSGNFSCLLWQKLFSTCEKNWGIPAEAVQPYLDQITANLQNHWQSALTGPLVRNDQETLRANINALKLNNDPYKIIYQAFVETYSSIIFEETPQ